MGRKAGGLGQVPVTATSDLAAFHALRMPFLISEAFGWTGILQMRFWDLVGFATVLEWSRVDLGISIALLNCWRIILTG